MGLLTETQIRAAKPGEKEYFLNDGDNLFLRIRSTGKAWVYRYERDGKPVKLGMGPYPAVTLAQARTKAYEANSQRANGLDPKEHRERQAEQSRIAQLNTFDRLRVPGMPAPRKIANGPRTTPARLSGTWRSTSSRG